MIKFVATGEDGKQALWIGLTQDNLDRLPTQPILIDMAELDHIRADQIVIVAGPSQPVLIEQLQKLGFPLPNWPEPGPGERREARDLH